MTVNDYALLHSAKQQIEQLRTEAKIQHHVKAEITTKHEQTKPLLNRLKIRFGRLPAQKQPKGIS